MIEQLPKGQLPDPHDPRDFQYSAILASAPVVNWFQGLRLDEPPDSDQGSADCCVGEASSYLHWAINRKQFSVRDVFAYIALDYGAYIRDGVMQIVNFGQETFAEIPDPNPKTVQNMRLKDGLNTKLASDDKELKAFGLPSMEMDYWADALSKYKGFVFGVQGTNEGWQNGMVPEPPKSADFEISGKVWGHALYAMGYHMHQNPDGTTEKCIIAKSSWCSWVKEHHIRERYFKAQCTNSAWVLIPNRKEPMKLVDVNGTVYLKGDKGALGLVDEKALEFFKSLDSTPSESMSVLDVPVSKLIENGLNIHN